MKKTNSPEQLFFQLIYPSVVKKEEIDQNEPKHCVIKKARILYFQHSSSDANIDMDIIKREKNVLLLAAKKLRW